MICSIITLLLLVSYYCTVLVNCVFSGSLLIQRCLMKCVIYVAS
jgi:hypothetical protein